jgi:hypothetical protein
MVGRGIIDRGINTAPMRLKGNEIFKGDKNMQKINPAHACCKLDQKFYTFGLGTILIFYGCDEF